MEGGVRMKRERLIASGGELVGNRGEREEGGARERSEDQIKGGEKNGGMERMG
jgi:hypothetical protein